MVSDEPGTIISLTYHEITADPRVLKEARALRAFGYDVKICCDWPEGFPKHDEIDGVRITRFPCYGVEGTTVAAFDAMDFLTTSRASMAVRYKPYASACEVLTAVKPYLEAHFGPDAFDRLKSSYFRRHRGLERVRRLMSYLAFHLKVRRFSRKTYMRYSSQRIGAALADFKRHRRQQFQAQSVAFWSNLSREEFSGRYAAVHAHDIYCLPAGVMLARQLGVPLVYDAHEYEPARATKIAVDGPELPELIENDCFPSIDRMITVSDGIAELYSKRYRGPTPTIVMNAPEVDIDRTAPTHSGLSHVQTVRDQVGVPDDVPLAVFTGGIQREKRGMDKVLEALVHLPGVQLASVGPRQASNDSWFLDHAKRLGVEARVTLLPPVDARDVPTVISTANVAICPLQDVSLNHRLAMPNKLFEAAFARVPICVSNLPEMRRFVETLGIGRTMDQTSPESIAEALRDVIDHPDKFAHSPETERKLAEIYSWPRQAEKLITLYQELVGPPQAENLETSSSAMR